MTDTTKLHILHYLKGGQFTPITTITPWDPTILEPSSTLQLLLKYLLKSRIQESPKTLLHL